MSQENVDLLRRVFSAYNAAFHTNDYSEFLALVDPDVDWRTSTEVLDPVYRGRDGIARWMREFHETWESLFIEPEEFVHATRDLVVVALRLRGRGKTSGVDVSMLLYEVITVRGGKLVGRHAFPDRAQALAAAGLPE